MPRWLFILAIAGITWLVLDAFESGTPQQVKDSISNAQLPEWETAAERTIHDRPEDAFQRAWNSSEKRAHEALRRSSSE